MPRDRLLGSYIVRVCLRRGLRRIRLHGVGSGEGHDFSSYRELSAFLAEHEEPEALGALREAALRSEAQLFGDAPPAAGAGPHKVLLARTTAASRRSSVVTLREIVDERHPVRWYSVVNGEGVEVGAVGRLTVTASGTRYWRLQDVDVFPAYRRRGYGDALLDAVVALAASDGAAAVIVAADQDDWPLAWYERRAFVRVTSVAKPTTVAFGATSS